MCGWYIWKSSIWEAEKKNERDEKGKVGDGQEEEENK